MRRACQALSLQDNDLVLENCHFYAFYDSLSSLDVASSFFSLLQLILMNHCIFLHLCDDYLPKRLFDFERMFQ